MSPQTWLEKASEEELIEHILNRYHDTHRDQLPDMIRLAQRVERVHGGHPECPSGLSAHLEAMQAELKLHSNLSELYGVTLGRAGGFVRPSFVKIVIERYFTYIDGAFKDFEKKYKNANLPKDIIDDCNKKVKWIKNKQSNFNTIYIGGSTG